MKTNDLELRHEVALSTLSLNNSSLCHVPLKKGGSGIVTLTSDSLFP